MTAEKVWFNSGGYRLSGNFFVPDSASEKPLPGLVYCSGFPGDKEGALEIAEALSDGGYSVLEFDYRGIRESEGEVDFTSQVEDLKAGLTYLKTREEVNKELIGVVGHCMGGAVAIVTAANDHRIKAVAVWDTPGNYKRNLRALRSLRGNIFIRIYIWLQRSRYRGKNILDQMKNLSHLDPIDHVKEISPRPLLIIHRKNDFIVPVDHAHEIYEQAGEPKKLVIAEGWKHYDKDPFYSSAERENGAIRITLDWLKGILKTSAATF